MWETIGFGLAGAMLVASLMEFIKRKKYNDKAEKNKMIAIALSLSALITPVLYYGFGLMGEPLSMVFYALAIYVVQKQLNMKAIRPIIKKIIQDKIEKI